MSIEAQKTRLKEQIAKQEQWNAWDEEFLNGQRDYLRWMKDMLAACDLPEKDRAEAIKNVKPWRI